MKNGLNENTWQHTYYVRDAQGNALAVYSSALAQSGSQYTATLKVQEYTLYGASRLGTHAIDLTVSVRIWSGGGYNSTTGIYSRPGTPATTGSAPSIFPQEGYISLVRGQKRYELSNHLGNVLAVISDRKLQNTTTWNTSKVYLPDVLSCTDYYAFGWEMPGRSSGSYRYGFNGQEQETDILGGEAAFSAEFWMYDSRSGRRWNVDPKGSIGISDYSVLGNNPIFYNDVNGDTIRGSKILYDQFRKEVNLKIEETNNKIRQTEYNIKNGGNVSKLEAELKKQKNTLDGLLETNTELDMLEKSKVDYFITDNYMYPEILSGFGGNGDYDIAAKKFRVNVSYSSSNRIATLAHELKHAFQYEAGKVAGGSAGRMIYDAQDEVEAYKRGQLFGANTKANIDAVWVKNRKSDDQLVGPYSKLGEDQFTVDSPYGEGTYRDIFISMNKNALKNGLRPMVCYNGWEKDIE